MKALSVRDPYARLIIYGFPLYEAVDNGDGSQRVEFAHKLLMKNVENRSWPIPAKMKLPQRIIIQVSARAEKGAYLKLIDMGLAYGVALTYTSPVATAPTLGTLIGEVDLVGCVKDSKSPWAIPGMYHWLLANPKPYPKPIPCKGQLRFFKVDIQEAK